MKNWLLKISVLFVGVFYMIAFLEIDIKDYKQTWNDSYDSYIINVKCDNSSFINFSYQKALEPLQAFYLDASLTRVSEYIVFRSFIVQTFVAVSLYLWHASFLT